MKILQLIILRYAPCACIETHLKILFSGLGFLVKFFMETFLKFHTFMTILQSSVLWNLLHVCHTIRLIHLSDKSSIIYYMESTFLKIVTFVEYLQPLKFWNNFPQYFTMNFKVSFVWFNFNNDKLNVEQLLTVAFWLPSENSTIIKFWDGFTVLWNWL